jgi:hypothetical protein
MQEPIKAGDLCEVIGGMGRGKSPNLGLIVKVVAFRGEHSQLGRMWRCEAPEVQQLSDAGTYIRTGWADFAQVWLKKINPPAPPPEKKVVSAGDKLAA